MGFMTLSIYISIMLVGGWSPDNTRLSLMHTLQRAHTQFRHTQIRWCFSALDWSLADTWPEILTRTCTQKAQTHTFQHTQSTFSISQHTDNLSTFTWSFLARLQWDAGEKCTGETETSCSACWHSQRVKGRQSGSLDCIDPCERGAVWLTAAVYKRLQLIKG